ncbi:transposase [Polycladomyces abyssicola]|uniref:transposase n=1 Tax=Polycladomyces abyssicola TaxID=1125966 RepID=UPI003B838563
MYIVMDSLLPYYHKKMKVWAKENHVKLAYTPTYTSWLNSIECHFGSLRKFFLEGSIYSTHTSWLRRAKNTYDGATDVNVTMRYL